MWLSFFQSLTFPILIIVMGLFVFAFYWSSKIDCALDEKTMDKLNDRALRAIVAGIYIAGLGSAIMFVTNHIDSEREYRRHMTDHAESVRQREEINKKLDILIKK